MSPPISSDLEFRAIEDEAWYRVAVELSSDGKTLKVLADGLAEGKPKFRTRDFKSAVEVDDFAAMFRPASHQLQDYECQRVTVGMTVCAFLKDDRRFYDAVVEEVQHEDHNGEEECSCAFLLRWKQGPRERYMDFGEIADIYLIEPTSVACSEIVSFLNLTKERILAANLKSSQSLGIEEHMDQPSLSKRGSQDNDLDRNLCQGIEDKSGENIGASDPGKSDRCYFVLIDNLDQNTPTSAMSQFLLHYTLVTPRVYLYPRRPFGSAAIATDSREEIEKIYAFLVNPDHLIMSSKGRPWVVYEKVFDDSCGAIGFLSQSQEIREELPSSCQDLKRRVYECYSSFIRRSRDISLSDAENHYSLEAFLFKEAGSNGGTESFLEQQHITENLQNWEHCPQLKLWKSNFNKHIKQLNIEICGHLAVQLVAAMKGDRSPNADSHKVVQEVYEKLASLASLADETFVEQKRYAIRLLKLLAVDVIRLLTRKRIFWLIYLRMGELGLKQLRSDMKSVKSFAEKGRYLSKTLLRLLSVKRKDAMILSPKRSWRNISLPILHSRSRKKIVQLAENQQLNISAHDVPTDVWSQVLSRLPVQSLIRFRCVSKGWKAMLQSPWLLKMHAGKRDHHSAMYLRRFGLIRHDKILYRDSWVIRHHHGQRHHRAGTLKKHFRLFFVHLRRLRGMIRLRKVGQSFSGMSISETFLTVHGSGNGFICLANQDPSVFLFNPAIQEWLQLPRLSSLHETPPPVIGFTFLVDTCQYKIIVASEEVVEMCEVGTDSSWRMLPCSLHGLDWFNRVEYDLGAVGVFVNNEWYWGAFHQIQSHNHFILTFSLSTEAFNRIEFPVEVLDQPPLAVLNGDLAFVTQWTQGKFDVWARKGDSWHRIYRVESFPPTHVYRPLGIWDSREIVVQRDGRSLMLCPLHLGGKGAKMYKFAGDHRQVAVMYQETLVSLRTMPPENSPQPHN